MKFVLAFLLWQNVAAFTLGPETQNGGGAAEQNFAYALQILKPLYRDCLASKICLRSEAQRAVLQMIFENMDRELANPVLLSFEDGDNPVFMQDGQVRIASTGLNVAAKIYVNRDMIYRSSIPFGVSEAIGVLTHELGHHTSLLGEHDFLDLLGGSVRVFFEMNNQKIIKDDFLNTYAHRPVSLSAYHQKANVQNHPDQTWLWLNVGEEVYDLNDDLRRQLQCPAGDTAGSFRLGRMHWLDEDWRIPGRITYALKGQILLYCSNAQLWISSRHHVRLSFDFHADTGKYIEKSMSVELQPFTGE